MYTSIAKAKFREETEQAYMKLPWEFSLLLFCVFCFVLCLLFCCVLQVEKVVETGTRGPGGL